MEQFTQLTGWDGARVLYFGDHIYSDLVDPSLKNGWRTGGIIPELEASDKEKERNYKKNRKYLNSHLSGYKVLFYFGLISHLSVVMIQALI